MNKITAKAILSELLEAYDECEHGDYFYDNGDSVCTAVECVLREQDATDTNVGSKWISVEERLPEVSGRYLVLRISGDCLDCSYDADRHGSHWGIMSDLGDEGKLWITLRTVTHWIPMPETPKEEV